MYVYFLCNTYRRESLLHMCNNDVTHADFPFNFSCAAISKTLVRARELVSLSIYIIVIYLYTQDLSFRFYIYNSITCVNQ